MMEGVKDSDDAAEPQSDSDSEDSGPPPLETSE
jgi:hypothetical protein